MRPVLVKLSKGFGIALVEIMDGINGSVKGYLSRVLCRSMLRRLPKG
jgi:hypothetical protein